MKFTIKNLVCAIIFICLCFWGIFNLEAVFEHKSTEVASKEYHKYERNKFDVIFLGPSTMKNAIYPMQLYNELGMASYNLAAGSQSLASTYYLAKEVIREQNPELIVVDCFFSAYEQEYLSNEHLHYVTDMMCGWEKYELIQDIVPLEYWSEFIFPMARYHDRWKDIEINDFMHTENYTYGAKIHFSSYPIENFNIIEESVSLPVISEKYLKKIIDLCEENKVKLLLVTLPVDFGGVHGTIGDMYQCQKYYNQISKIAEENNVTYLNFMYEAENVGLDYMKDFDGGYHLNAYGAPKMTSYLGEFIKNNYEIPDVRGNSEYSFMASDYDEFIKYFNERSLVAEKNIVEYFSMLNQMDNYSIIISVRDIQGYYLTPEIIEKMKNLGFLKADILIEREYHGYIGILSNGRCIYEAVSNEHVPLYYEGELLDKSVSVVSETLNGGNRSSIKINDVEYSLNWRGFNIVVICNETGKIVDRVCFDTHVPEFTCYR